MTPALMDIVVKKEKMPFSPGLGTVLVLLCPLLF